MEGIFFILDYLSDSLIHLLVVVELSHLVVKFVFGWCILLCCKFQCILFGLFDPGGVGAVNGIVLSEFDGCGVAGKEGKGVGDFHRFFSCVFYWL